MADEQTPKRVVKRVVKKPSASPSAPRPTVRYGRPVAPSQPSPDAKPAVARTPRKKRPKSKSAAPVAADSQGATLVDEQPAAPSQVQKPARRPTRERLGSAGSGIAGGFGRLRDAVTGAFWWAADGVRGWRLPRWDAVPAALATGVVTGLVSVLLGLGALQLFTWLRGVASGGGTWGSLTFVVVGFMAFVVGELLLSGFGVASPRLTSFLGVVITIVAILGLFLDESDTRMALLVVPAVAATAFTLAHWLMSAAEAGAESEE